MWLQGLRNTLFEAESGGYMIRSAFGSSGMGCNSTLLTNPLLLLFPPPTHHHHCGCTLPFFFFFAGISSHCTQWLLTHAEWAEVRGRDWPTLTPTNLDHLGFFYGDSKLSLLWLIKFLVCSPHRPAPFDHIPSTATRVAGMASDRLEHSLL